MTDYIVVVVYCVFPHIVQSTTTWSVIGLWLTDLTQKVLQTNRKEGRKEGNVLFNDALITFLLRLYGAGHVVKDHSDSERGNQLPPLFRLLFPISSKGYFICAIPYIQDSIYYCLCYTSRGAQAGTINSSMSPPRRIDPTT